MLIDRILATLKKARFGNIPEDKNKNLFNLGIDSLILALWVIELEKEFNIKIPLMPLQKERFETLTSTEKYLIELGAI